VLSYGAAIAQRWVAGMCRDTIEGVRRSGRYSISLDISGVEGRADEAGEGGLVSSGKVSLSEFGQQEGGQRNREKQLTSIVILNTGVKVVSQMRRSVDVDKAAQLARVELVHGRVEVARLTGFGKDGESWAPVFLAGELKRKAERRTTMAIRWLVCRLWPRVGRRPERESGRHVGFSFRIHGDFHATEYNCWNDFNQNNFWKQVRFFMELIPVLLCPRFTPSLTGAAGAMS
jgi:hypothetical protein